MLSDLEVRENLAFNVRRLLSARGWSQADLARNANESEMNISRVVRAASVVGTGVVARIAEAFDVSVDRLLAPPAEKFSQKIARVG